MAFITENGSVISFADYSDVLKADQRIFDGNEGLTDLIVETACIRATERILQKIRMSSWWRDYYIRRDPSVQITNRSDVPPVDPNKIAARENDFTDLCVYWALSEYILPQVADFGDETDSDRAKMGYYTNRRDALLGELIESGDWYDFDGDSTVESSEKQPGAYLLRRVR